MKRKAEMEEPAPVDPLEAFKRRALAAIASANARLKEAIEALPDRQLLARLPAHKRAVVELLMCSASTDGGETTYEVGRDLEISMIPIGIAGNVWLVVARDLGIEHPGVCFANADVCLEAAYRLVETSADLRMEWFGR